LKAFLGGLPGFAVFPLVCRLACPLASLRIDIGQIGEGPQRPEALANVADGPLHFAFLPGCGDMTGARNEVVFAGKRKEAGIEADQIAVVFCNCGCEIVEPDFTAAAAHVLEGMDVTANERLEALAMSELDIHASAVALDHTEGIELARRAVVDQRAEVPPVDIAAFARARLHAHVRAAGFALGPNGVNVVANDGDAAVVSERANAVMDRSRRRRGVALEQFGDGRLERIELAGPVAPRHRRGGVPDVFAQRAPSDFQVLCDFALRPLLDTVQAVNRVDLIRGKHRHPRYTVISATGPAGCSFQDLRPRGRAAKPRQRNALGPELRCSLQDS
jgi:hypothetical protein